MPKTVHSLIQCCRNAFGDPTSLRNARPACGSPNQASALHGTRITLLTIQIRAIPPYRRIEQDVWLTPAVWEYPRPSPEPVRSECLPERNHDAMLEPVNTVLKAVKTPEFAARRQRARGRAGADRPHVHKNSAIAAASASSPPTCWNPA